MSEKKFGGNHPDRLPSRKAIKIFLLIRQCMLILFALSGMGMLVFICWLMIFADPTDAIFGDEGRPSWGIRLAAIGFVLIWNFLVHIFLQGNNKRLKLVKDEIRRQNSEG